MKKSRFTAAVAALSMVGGPGMASEENPHDIFNAAITGEFGEVIRTQALLEEVCKDPASASLLVQRSQKTLAPFMPSLQGIELEDWRQIAGTVYQHSLQYRAGYAAGVQRGLVLSAGGDPSPTARLCEAAITDAKRWIAK